MLLREGTRMTRKFVGALLSLPKFFKISHFFSFFYVFAQISAPVGRHGWRLWQMKAVSLELLFATVLAQGEPLALTNHKNKNSLLFFGNSGSLFYVFFFGLPWFLVQANASLFLGLNLLNSLFRRICWRKDLT